MSSLDLNHRKAGLATLAQALNDQRTRSVDLVAPAGSVIFRDGNLVITGQEPVLGDNGVTEVNGLYRPTAIALEGLADKGKTDIPLRYLRRMHANAPELFDTNVNHWLGQADASYLLRLLTGDGPGSDASDGVLRAILSDRYRTIDSFDVLLAALAGLQEVEGGTDVKVEGDLTERRMVVRVTSKAVSVRAPELLKDYRSPYTGQTGRDLPVVWAGFVISNSETGGGAFGITPRAEVEICTNGMTIKRDMMREVHLGVKLSEGVVKPSDETIGRVLALVTSQVKDAVNTFMSEDYLSKAIKDLERDAGVPVEDAPATVQAVSKRLGFTEDQANSILNRFIQGADLTSGGIMQAVTAAAQDQDNGDDALSMELAAIEAMQLAAGTLR